LLPLPDGELVGVNDDRKNRPSVQQLRGLLLWKTAKVLQNPLTYYLPMNLFYHIDILMANFF